MDSSYLQDPFGEFLDHGSETVALLGSRWRAWKEYAMISVPGWDQLFMKSYPGIRWGGGLDFAPCQDQGWSTRSSQTWLAMN